MSNLESLKTLHMKLHKEGMDVSTISEMKTLEGSQKTITCVTDNWVVD